VLIEVIVTFGDMIKTTVGPEELGSLLFLKIENG
jgi:hypothetical protein